MDAACFFKIFTITEKRWRSNIDWLLEVNNEFIKQLENFLEFTMSEN
jgi:hypothetical protein